jgi:hypothetical protein
MSFYKMKCLTTKFSLKIILKFQYQSYPHPEMETSLIQFHSFFTHIIFSPKICLKVIDLTVDCALIGSLLLQ